MNLFVLNLWKKIVKSYFLQFAIIVFLVFAAFYKVLDFTFHANREMAYIIEITGGDYSFFNLIKSHGFISLFNLKVFGPNPSGWYLTAIVLHILAVWALIVFVGNLTKSRVLGFLTGIWFGVNLAWHDVITFGSQQSMYAAEMLLFFISIYFYKRFRENKIPKLSYIISLVVLTINLPLRELGLIFFPIVFFYDIIFHFKYRLKRSVKANLISLIRFLTPQIPFIIIAISYFIFQQKYGEVPVYFVDDRVQYKVNLFEQKKYIEYLLISILSFGTFIPPQLIPYPLLNFLREAVTIVLPIQFIKVYFFSILGSIIYIGLVFLAYLRRKTPSFKLLVFALAIIAIPILFYSTAVSMDEYRFRTPYEDEGNRYRYFSFFGTSLFIVIYFSTFLKRFKIKVSRFIIFFGIVANLIINVFFIWYVENRMYNQMFKTQKLFYKTIFKIFPTYSKNYTIYLPPYSYSLGDYITEWHNLSSFYYPNIGEIRRDWSYSEMEKVLKNLLENKLSLKDIFFIDFNPFYGVMDFSQKAKNEILNQKEVDLIKEETLVNSKIDIKVNDISPVEFPYLAEITMKANLNLSDSEKPINTDKIETLLTYKNNHVELLSQMKADEVCGTHGSFINFDKERLTDGNFGDRSTWMAGCFPAWLILDLGKNYNISGFLMKGPKNDPHLPSNYYYEVSTDRKKWEKVLDVKNSNRAGAMDKWQKPYDTRYIRISITGTQRLGTILIEEVEPVLSGNEKIFKYWLDWEDLMTDARNLLPVGMNKSSFVRLSWKASLTNVPEEQRTFYFPFLADGQYHTYEIPIYESEMFSFRDQFLKRKITEVSLNFSKFPGSISILDFTLKPKYPIAETIKIVN